jgi:putative colanic acid biosysnthesis UDP-glucose lipid carrier transferase
MPETSIPLRRFHSAPQSVASLAAALADPVLAVLAYALAAAGTDQSLSNADQLLCLLTFVLVFPGHNRFWRAPLDAWVDIGASWGVTLMVLALCGYATSSLAHFNPNQLLAWALLTPLLQGLAYAAGRYLLLALGSRPSQRRRAVVIGAGDLGAKVVDALRARGQVGHELLGCFDDRGGQRIHAALQPHHRGELSEVADFVRVQAVHEVYITLPLSSQPRIALLLEQLQGTTASLYFVPDVFGISIIQGRLHEMNGVPVVGLCETPFTGINGLLKRGSDLVLASAILVLIAPVLLAIAVGVKLSSPGPIVFRQRRNGLDGEEIVVYKFRSMRTQDDGQHIRQATRQDARITPFGAFLRRTSLDELPQFVNVLQGRMSIVGPRPHAVAHNETYRSIIKAYMVRHKVKPGITGWAQVNGCRGETETVDKMRDRVAYDLAYLRDWSLRMDLRIIARTVKLVFADANAY